ncbi:tol-pal system-associated acyl-CoA thioesterase [Taklimakanibacter lacteus]|uniref:tol-pal system-associated acyl-CoA thioesterase n=1 Tax=Taklimakanibacter lacteus TaxID=2268456 RepID=UPI000E6719B0
MTEGTEIAGRIAGDHHVLPVRIYYEDTDFSGAVYHANYLKFCERGRSDCLRLLGIHHHEMHWHETEGRMGFVVRRMVCDFLKPARIDDLLEVETRFREMAGARMELDQRVVRGGETLFSAQVTVVLVDAAGRPKRLPKAMAAALKTF